MPRTKAPTPIWRYPAIFFGIFYHIWYYALMLISILGLFVPLFRSSRKVESFPRFYRFARLWAAWILNGMGLVRKVTYATRIPWDRPYIVVANHSSEIDIMMCYRIVKSPTVFIGKAELAKILSLASSSADPASPSTEAAYQVKSKSWKKPPVALSAVRASASTPKAASPRTQLSF